MVIFSHNRNGVAVHGGPKDRKAEFNGFVPAEVCADAINSFGHLLCVSSREYQDFTAHEFAAIIAIECDLECNEWARKLVENLKSLMPFPKTFAEAEEIYQWQKIQLFSRSLLGRMLVPSDSHEGEAWMTSDQAFYFVSTDEPVMTGARIGHEPKPIEGRFQIAIEIGVCYPGGHMEPDDYDLSEIGRESSLEKAIEFAAHKLLDQKIANEGESLFWQKERLMEPFIEQAFDGIR